ncbi:MAG: hypothetical protein ACKPBV_00855 [Sphaerospermopsis kisseleviana]
MKTRSAQAMKNNSRILTVVCLLKLLSWSSPAIAQETLPCLDSSKECVEQLTQRAIANSAKLKTLDDRLALIDKRLEVSKDSIDYANSKLWTNYLPSSTSFGGSVFDIINPFAWIKNFAGGGEMQRDQLAIADLEVKAATLEATRAELERQREEEKVKLGEKVLRLLLDYEAVSRKYALVESQLKTYNQQQAILKIRYRLGQGETAEFLESQVKGEALRGQLVELESLLSEKVRELVQLIGDESVNSLITDN